MGKSSEQLVDTPNSETKDRDLSKPVFDSEEVSRKFCLAASMALDSGKPKGEMIGYLQSELNKWSSQVGLGNLEIIGADDKLESSTQARYENGPILIREKKLGHPEMKDTLAHEITHRDQHMLFIRLLMDQLKIGTSLDTKQRQDLDAAHRRIDGEPAPDDLVNEVLSQRAGKELSPLERQRAEKLVEDASKSKEVVAIYQNLVAQDRALHQLRLMMIDLGAKEGLRLLIDQHKESGAEVLALALFDATEDLADRLIDKFGDPRLPGFDADKAYDSVRMLIKERKDILSDRGEVAFQNYQNLFTETEAFRIEKKVGKICREMKAK